MFVCMLTRTHTHIHAYIYIYIYIYIVIYVFRRVNPSLPEFFFRRFSGLPKIGSFRLPTHSRGAHRKFVSYDPS